MNKHIELPAPSFRLTWKGDKAAYYVDKPNIDSTDCYTPDDVRAAIAAQQRVLAEQAGPVAYWIPKAEQFCLADPKGRPFAKSWEPLFASPPTPQEAQAGRVPWENFPAYLIDHCEGDTITEEGLQFALAKMLQDPQYAAPVVQPATEPRPLTQDEHEVMRAAQRSSAVVVHPGRLATEQAEAPSEREALREALSELVDIVQHAIDEKSTEDMDSFTLQPARAALATQPTASNAGEREAIFALAKNVADEHGDWSVAEYGVQFTAEELLEFAAALASKPVAPPARESLVTQLEWFALAAHWYINASDRELSESGQSRGDALKQVHLLSGHLEASGFNFSATTPAPAGQLGDDAIKACIAMAKDGWLMHGPEGMSTEQRMVYDVYTKCAARGDEVNQK